MGCGASSLGCMDDPRKFFNKNSFIPQSTPDSNRVYLSDIPIEKPNFNTEKIIKYYKNQIPPDSNTKFTDDIFPPNNNSIFGLDKNNNPTDPHKERISKHKINIKHEEIIWLQASEIFHDGKFAVFEDTISINDVKQGAVGNCYFHAAISAMAENPQLIAQIFKTQTVQENGCYQISMRINGEWKIVLVDDYFPCYKSKREPLFSKPANAEIWVMLLEKAWAKINGGFINIISGYATEVLGTLTNFPKELISHSNIKSDLLWEKIKLADEKNHIMACCSKFDKTVETLGIVSGHAFTLIGYKEAKINKTNVRLLRIRNPWGYKEWNGAWSDMSKDWTEETKKAFDYTPGGDDGAFWIRWEDFLKYYTFTEICSVIDPLCSKIYKFDKNDMKKSSIFQIYMAQKSLFNITVIKKHYRFNRKIPQNALLPFRIVLAKMEDDQLSVIKNVYNHWESPLISIELNEGNYIVLIQPDFEKHTYDKERKYVIDFSASGFFGIDFKGLDEESEIISKYLNKTITHDAKISLLKSNNFSENKDFIFEPNYFDFVFKNISVDFKKIYEKIDSYQSSVDYYSKKYPKQMKELLKIDKYDDGSNLIFKSYEWPGIIYIGDWNAEQNNKQGRGVYIWQDDVFTCGPFKNDKLNGKCIEVNKKIRMNINYTNGERDGIGEIIKENGNAGKQEYRMGKFVRYIE